MSGKLKIIISFLVLITLVVISYFIINNYKEKTSFKYRGDNSQKAKISEQDKVTKYSIDNSSNKTAFKPVNKALQVSDSELYLGNKNAPVVIIEYASLSCPHCASFYRKAFDELKEEYIKSGKVKFIYRDFPLNQPALAGAMAAVCRSKIEIEDPAGAYYDFLKVLFKNQDRWAYDPKFIDKIESIAVLDGMSEQQFRSCVSDQILQEKILQARLVAAKSLNIASTPTFFINDSSIEGFVDYKTIKEAIEKELNNNS